MKKISLEKLFIQGTVKSVIGLGVTTTIGYGTLFYSFTLMSIELENYFGWSKSFLFGVFSFGLLLGGFITPYIGKKLDHHGARIIMSIGSILAFIGLMLLSQVENKLEYILAIIFLEMVSTFILYEAAFVAFSQIAKEKARLPMAQITLIAGFASTIFWPLISVLLQYLSWQQVYMILALFHLFIAFPLHYFTLPKSLEIEIKKEEQETFDIDESVTKDQKRKSMIYIGIALCCIAFPITVIQTHLVGILNSFGIKEIVAVTLGALIGPAQVGARIIEMSISKKVTPIMSAIASSLLLFISMGALLLIGYDLSFAYIFALFYGAGQGLNYIARGALPLYILGADNYGRNSGILNLFVKIVIAIAPFSFAFIFDRMGNIVSVSFLLVLSLLAIISLNFIPKESNV